MGLPGTSPFTYVPEWELYDMHTDPDELVNVYPDPDYREIREQLKVKLWKLQASLGDEPHPAQPAPELVPTTHEDDRPGSPGRDAVRPSS